MLQCIVRVESKKLRSKEVEALFEKFDDHLVIDPDQEVADSTNAGFKPLLLGKRVLRTETASLVAIANMQLLWGS